MFEDLKKLGLLGEAAADAISNRILAIILLNKLGGKVVINRDEANKAIEMFAEDLIHEEQGENDTCIISVLESEEV